MISKDTATDIALAYREVEVAEELLKKVSEEMGRGRVPDIRDAFGRPINGLQLGIPTDPVGSRRLFEVPWSLAKPIIEAHIAGIRAKIALLMEQARGELSDAGERGDG